MTFIVSVSIVLPAAPGVPLAGSLPEGCAGVRVCALA